MSTGPTDFLELNIAPVAFSTDSMSIGHLGFMEKEQYKLLREKHWNTHVFRFDAASQEVLNVSILDGPPLGSVDEVAILDHLLLAARAVQQQILLWIARKCPVLANTKRLIFWGMADEALLLSQALEKARFASIEGLEVPIRYDIDCRIFENRDGEPFAGLVIDVNSTNVIEIPVSELLRSGVTVKGNYVCRRREPEHPDLRPGLELLGMVSSVSGQTLYLADSEGIAEIPANEVMLEPRQENMDMVIRAKCGTSADKVLGNLKQLRQPIVAAPGRLALCRKTLKLLQGHPITIANGVSVKLGSFLNSDSADFPERVATERPALLFGAQGRNRGSYADFGIRQWGPYMYMQHSRTTPTIAVVCEATHRGSVEQFVESLLTGYPDELWTDDRTDNPFVGGLLGKFKLARYAVEYEECAGDSATDYRAAVKRLLERMPELPDLAIVQIRESFTELHSGENPYLVAKSVFMVAGVPVQAVRIEKMQLPSYDLAHLLNTVALACYAKLDGTPWVILSRETTTHEIVIGIGSAEVHRGRFGDHERYVGISTLFQGDGRYMVWGLTRDVSLEEFPEALVESLRTTVRYVSTANAWKPGDNVRLIFHVYKSLKRTEIDAVKTLVRELVDGKYQVRFAFLDVSSYHPYRIFAPNQRGIRARNGRYKGQGVPERGLCLLLDDRRALLQLTGIKEIKTAEQGLPAPLFVELHRDSDFDLRQMYHFTYASWRSFFPAHEPVTIMYSRLIAKTLGNIRAIPGWSSSSVTVGSLRDRRWFL